RGCRPGRPWRRTCWASSTAPTSPAARRRWRAADRGGGSAPRSGTCWRAPRGRCCA
ncbi:MAG: hypothetical protein AVDCRST_MAG35-1638, partial [uncultured Quadrisphaera sp.]